jgi:hypothetical protein
MKKQEAAIKEVMLSGLPTARSNPLSPARSKCCVENIIPYKRQNGLNLALRGL